MVRCCFLSHTHQMFTAHLPVLWGLFRSRPAGWFLLLLPSPEHHSSAIDPASSLPEPFLFSVLGCHLSFRSQALQRGRKSGRRGSGRSKEEINVPKSKQIFFFEGRCSLWRGRASWGESSQRGISGKFPVFQDFRGGG